LATSQFATAINGFGSIFSSSLASFSSCSCKAFSLVEIHLLAAWTAANASTTDHAQYERAILLPCATAHLFVDRAIKPVMLQSDRNEFA